MATLYACSACGRPAGDLPFGCPAAGAGDDRDHVLRKWLDSARECNDEASASNPFERYCRRLSFWEFGRSRGLDDSMLLDLVRELDTRVAEVDGRGFLVTPFHEQTALAARMPAALAPAHIFVKDETGNVSGSHKARHLMGVMLYLLVAERAGVLTSRPPLAIASCGNAALAAAVVARAAGWPLLVFVPASAHPAVLARLERLDASVTACHRSPGVAGDPCYHAFRAAIEQGAIPFCCQGSDNALTIEGGATIAWEIVDSRGGMPLDAIFVQVGGGALASGVAQGFDEACRRGAIGHVPRLYTVQTRGGSPLARAYARVLARFPNASGDDEQTRRAMRYARCHRSEFMWPWEDEPSSIAHGILDDETYDWAAVVEGMLWTGGQPIVVGEERLHEANSLARSTTGIDVDHTGSAGLAGLIEALSQDGRLDGASVGVIFSGVRRREAPLA